MAYPTNLKYTKEHEWVDLKADGTAIVGITAYALEQLGDVVFLELPKVGSDIANGSSFGTIESTKTVSDLYAPASGKVLEVNPKLSGDNYDTLTGDPYGTGWLLKMKVDKAGSELMSASDYENYISEQE